MAIATLTNPSKQKALELRALLANNIKTLETLSAIADKVPRATIESTWEILKNDISKGTPKPLGRPFSSLS